MWKGAVEEKTMLLLKFILFACYVAGSYAMSIECYSQGNLQCIDYMMEKPELPKTIDDIRDFCTNFIPLGNCLVGVMEKCVKDGVFRDREEDLENLKAVLKFVESSCDEDSHIFKVITDNLNCVTSTSESMDGLCHWEGVNGTRYRKELEDLVDEEPEGCVLDAWPYHCMLARYDVECGDDVKDAVTEIFDKTDFFNIHCLEVRQLLSYFQDAFRSQFELGKTGQEALEGVFEAIREKEA